MLPPVRVRQVYHAGQGQGKRAHAHHPHHLRDLDLAWSVVLNPRGSRGRVAGTADGRQAGDFGQLTVGRKDGRGDRLPAPAGRTAFPLQVFIACSLLLGT